MNILAKLLLSKLRTDIFRLLFSALNSDMPMADIEKRLGGSLNDLQTEMKKLVDLNLVLKRQEGDGTYYRVNTEHPLYPQLKAVAEKTIRLAGRLGKRRRK